MNCPKCGTQNRDGVSFCGSCGAQIAYQAPPQSSQAPPPNYYGDPPYNQQPSQPFNAPFNRGPYGGSAIPPKDYLTESIIVTIISFLCCCSPVSIILGIIAIVKANNVKSEFERGNVNEAVDNADTAKKLTMWAAILSVVFYIVYMILYFAFFAVALRESGAFDRIW
jgi:hypothetical protein